MKSEIKDPTDKCCHKNVKAHHKALIYGNHMHCLMARPLEFDGISVLCGTGYAHYVKPYLAHE